MFNFFKKKNENKILATTHEQHREDYSDASAVANYFQKLTGIVFQKQLTILQSKLMLFCKKRCIYSFGELLEKVQKEENLQQELINHLTTNETYFYREYVQIEELVLLAKGYSKPFNILCAPSSTGEEPYSIAIALLEAGITNSFKIVGIDINAQTILKAKEAIYKQRNIRNLSEDVLAKYFFHDGEVYALKEEVKSLVTFHAMNIFDEHFAQLGKFDFVFSRNMLIYFDKETKQKAKNILESMRKETTHKVFFGHADLF